MTTEELVKKINSSDYVLAELKIDKSGPKEEVKDDAC